MHYSRAGAPTHISQFALDKFTKWLKDRGALVLDPTNEWEVIRYRTYVDNGQTLEIHIIYRKASGHITWTGSSREHYRAMQLGKKRLFSVMAPAKQETLTSHQKKSVRAQLLERDGQACWFCSKLLGDDITIEHLLPQSTGGSDSLANLVLAHAECNRLAASKSLGEKIDLRIQLTQQAQEGAPWN